MKKALQWVGIFLSLCLTASAHAETDAEAAEKIKKASQKLEAILEKVDSASNSRVQFTVSGYSGSTYRLEGGKADRAAMVTEANQDGCKSAAAILRLHLYDEASRTDISINGSNLNLAHSSEQVIPTTYHSEGVVIFNAKNAMAHATKIVATWKDSFDNIYRNLYCNYSDDSCSGARWIIHQCEDLGSGIGSKKLHIRGSVTFPAANNPFNSSAKDYSKELENAILKESRSHPMREPMYNADLAKTTPISVRGEFDVTVYVR